MFDTVLNINAKKYHSAILTTFSFDFQYMDEQVRRQLRSKGIYNIVTLIDDGMLQQTLGKFSGYLHHLGKQYSITPVKAARVFHPKIMCLIGEESALIQIGSGNLTLSGHGENHEIWTRFKIDKKDKSNLALLQEVWQYLNTFFENASDIVQRQIKWMYDNSTLLNDDLTTNSDWILLKKIQYKFIANRNKSNIFKQLSTLLPINEVTKITIIAPYFDKKALLLERLTIQYPNAIIKVLVQKHFSILPDNLPQNKRIKFYEWNAENAKSIYKSAHKRQHSKIFQLLTKDKEYILIGSMNASIAAFGTLEIPYKNEEAGVLFQRKKDDFLKELGISISSEPLTSFDGFNSIELEQETLESKKYQLVRLHSVELFQNKIKIKISPKATVISEFSLRLFDGLGNDSIMIDNLVKQQENSYEAAINRVDFPNVTYGQLFENEKLISNKQLVNHVENLYKGNPSKQNKALNKVLEHLESLNGHISIDLLDFFNSLKTTNKKPSEKKQSGHSVSTEKESEVTYNEMTYEDFRNLANQANQNQLFEQFRNHNTIQILEALFQRENLKNELEENQQFDEESEEDIVEKTAEIPTKATISLASIPIYERLQKRFNRYFDKYNDILTNEFNKHQKIKRVERTPINIIDLAKFLILVYILIDNFEREILIKEERKILLAKKINNDVAINFESLSYKVLGHFAQFVAIKSTADLTFPDDYTKQQHEIYTQKAFTYSVFVLFINALSEKNGKEKQPYFDSEFNEWILPLYCNFRLHLIGFEVQRPDIQRDILQLLALSDIQISMESFYQFYNECEKAFEINKTNLKQDVGLYQNRHKFVMYRSGVLKPTILEYLKPKNVKRKRL